MPFIDAIVTIIVGAIAALRSDGARGDPANSTFASLAGTVRIFNTVSARATCWARPSTVQASLGTVCNAVVAIG